MQGNLDVKTMIFSKCIIDNHLKPMNIGHLTNYGQKANFWTFSIFSHKRNYLGGLPRSHGFG